MDQRVPGRVDRRWRDVAVGLFAVAWGANQFVSVLVAYREHLGLSTATNDGLFASYALALIIALLIGGPLADVIGRAAIVRPAVALSLVATVLLMIGAQSTPSLYAGRLASGLASGAIFAAGSAWVKELSGPGGAGARRAALALTFGFGLGPLCTGLIAQWAPHPLVLAYVPHLVIALVAIPLVWRAPETVPTARRRGWSWARLRVPAVRQSRFLRVVLPAAPWVFGAPSVAFVVLPSLVSAHVHGYAVVYSAVLAAVTLGTGVAVQPLARRLDRPGRVDGLLLSLGTTVVGMLIGVAAAWHGNALVALLACVPLGAGYGMGLVSGLLETERLADAQELAGLTGVYYALTYIGFVLPLALAEVHAVASYPLMLGVVSALALVSLVVVASSRRVQPGVLRNESAAERR